MAVNILWNRRHLTTIRLIGHTRRFSSFLEKTESTRTESLTPLSNSKPKLATEEDNSFRLSPSRFLTCTKIMLGLDTQSSSEHTLLQEPDGLLVSPVT